MNKYGERLKEYRKIHGLTQISMAKKLSITQSNYSRLEKGEQDIKLSMILNICESLNIGSDWFLGISDEYDTTNETMKFYTEIVDAIVEMEENEEISEKAASLVLRKVDRISLHFNMD